MMISSGAPMFGSIENVLLWPRPPVAGVILAPESVAPIGRGSSDGRLWVVGIERGTRDAARYVDEETAARCSCHRPTANRSLSHGRLEVAALAAEPRHEER